MTLSPEAREEVAWRETGKDAWAREGAKIKLTRTPRGCFWRVAFDDGGAFHADTLEEGQAYADDRIARLSASPAPTASGGLEAVLEMETRGPYEARVCKDVPSDCCDYGVVSLSEGREVCRVWREQDARAIAAALAAPATPAGAGGEAVAPDFPMGAIENGRAFADRLELTGLESPAGDLRMCADWQEFRRCFEYLAEWALHRATHPAPDTGAGVGKVKRDDPFRPAVDVDADDDYYPSREEE